LEVALDIGEERPAIVIEPVEDPIRRPAEQPVPVEPERVETPA
jgi:hypothetical protein